MRMCDFVQSVVCILDTIDHSRATLIMFIMQFKEAWEELHLV